MLLGDGYLVPNDRKCAFDASWPSLIHPKLQLLLAAVLWAEQTRPDPEPRGVWIIRRSRPSVLGSVSATAPDLTDGWEPVLQACHAAWPSFAPALFGQLLAAVTTGVVSSMMLCRPFVKEGDLCNFLCFHACFCSLLFWRSLI
jgi:hypothetical protein